MISSFKGFGQPKAPKSRPPRLKVMKPRSSGWDSVLAEFRESAIPDRLTACNVQWVEGRLAIEIMIENALLKAQKVTSFLTEAGKRLFKRYENFWAGGWWGVGKTREGESGAVPYFKPKNPRFDFEKKKYIKYETPSKLPATPLLPFVDPETAQQIFDRFGITPTEGETFWQAVWRCGLPVTITEGFKKALSLVAHGIPAIALRGVDNGFKKGTVELHDAIADFATAGREIYIIFDQDTKPRTVKNVSWSLAKLGRAFEAKGCKVKVPVWQPSLGKGIDDVLVGQGDDSQDWLAQLLGSAPSFQDWQKNIIKARLLSSLRLLNSLNITAERVTEGRYLPELPKSELGTIEVVSTLQGAGKTVRLGADRVDPNRFTIAFFPLISLGKGAAEQWGLPHIGDYEVGDRAHYQAFVADALYRGGVALCTNSLHRIEEILKEVESRGISITVILDEANQVLEDLNNGETLKERQGDIFERFTNLLRIAANNGLIVLSEDGIYQRTVDQIKALSGIERVRFFEHKSTAQPWACTLSTGDISGFVAQVIEAVASGKKLILTTSTKSYGKRIEYLLSSIFGVSKTTIRIDSETNQEGQFDDFWRNPDEYLKSLPKLPDLLILSPSAKSGVSITIPGFDEVWGLFTCHHAAMWSQQLGRYRLPVPRKIFVSRLIQSSYEELLCSPRAVKRHLDVNQRNYAKLWNLAEVLELKDEREEQFLTIERSQCDFYADNQTAIGIQKRYPVECLTELLESKGHTITLETIKVDPGVKEALKQIQEQIWREDAAAMAAANPGGMSAKEASAVLNSGNLSTQAMLAARKVLLREEFSGVDFNDPEECYQALTKDFGAMARGVRLQARAMNLGAAKLKDSHDVEAILSGRVKLPHRLPKSFFKAALIQQLGILMLLDGVPYTEDDSRVQAIKAAALHLANDIRKYFSLNVKPDQTGVEIINKLLRRLALKAECIKQEGSRGHQVRIWGIVDLCDSTRVRLLQASFRKFDGDQSAILTEYPESYHQVTREAEEQKEEWNSIECKRYEAGTSIWTEEEESDRWDWEVCSDDRP